MCRTRIDQGVEDTNGVTGVLNVCHAASSQNMITHGVICMGIVEENIYNAPLMFFFWKGLHWLPVYCAKDGFGAILLQCA